MSLNTIKIPTLEQLREVAAELGLTFSEADLGAHCEALRPAFEAYNRLDRMPDELPPVNLSALARPPPSARGKPARRLVRQDRGRRRRARASSKARTSR